MLNNKLKAEVKPCKTKTAESVKAVRLSSGLYFADIKKKFPNSYKLLIEYYTIDEPLIGYRYFDGDYLNRNLYNFFDGQGIHIEIRWIAGDEFIYDGEELEERKIDDKFFTKSFYESAIYLEGNEATEEKFISSPSKTRWEAESESFIRSFEILEGKI